MTISSLDAANAAMAPLPAALKILRDDLINGIVDPADAEDLAAQMKDQSDALAEAIATAKAARGA